MRNKIQTPWKYTEIKDIYSFPPPMAFANTKFWEMIALEFLKVFRHQIMEGTFKDFIIITVCIYVCVGVCVCGNPCACRVQKRALESLEPKLRVAVSHLMWM